MPSVFLLAYSIHTLIWVYEKTDENSANKNGIVVPSMNFSLYIYLSIAIHIHVYTRVCICMYVFVRSFLTVKVSSSIHQKKAALFLLACLFCLSKVVCFAGKRKLPLVMSSLSFVFRWKGRTYYLYFYY